MCHPELNLSFIASETSNNRGELLNSCFKGGDSPWLEGGFSRLLGLFLGFSLPNKVALPRGELTPFFGSIEADLTFKLGIVLVLVISIGFVAILPGSCVSSPIARGRHCRDVDSLRGCSAVELLLLDVVIELLNTFVKGFRSDVSEMEDITVFKPGSVMPWRKWRRLAFSSRPVYEPKSLSLSRMMC